MVDVVVVSVEIAMRLMDEVEDMAEDEVEDVAKDMVEDMAEDMAENEMEDVAEVREPGARRRNRSCKV